MVLAISVLCEDGYVGCGWLWVCVISYGRGLSPVIYWHRWIQSSNICLVWSLFMISSCPARFAVIMMTGRALRSYYSGSFRSSNSNSTQLKLSQLVYDELFQHYNMSDSNHQPKRICFSAFPAPSNKHVHMLNVHQNSQLLSFFQGDTR